MLILLASALAATAAQAAVPAAAPPAVEEKKICRREQVTGSNFLRKVCRTDAEWKALSAASEQARESALARGTGNRNLPGGSGN